MYNIYNPFLITSILHEENNKYVGPILSRASDQSLFAAMLERCGDDMEASTVPEGETKKSEDTDPGRI